MLESLTHLTQITEWSSSTRRSLGEERYLYIKIVVIGVRLFCGQRVKVLVRREKLSLLLVDKPVESVDNQWIDLPSTPSCREFSF